VALWLVGELAAMIAAAPVESVIELDSALVTAPALTENWSL
jgi:hypothetical protein